MRLDQNRADSYFEPGTLRLHRRRVEDYEINIDGRIFRLRERPRAAVP